MGELILISGPNDSGKSRFAESLLARVGLPRFYIATMVPRTAENRERIEKHRRQRAGLDFTTLERPWPLADAPLPPESAVLLEDVSNLLGNAIFVHGADGAAAEAELAALQGRCALLTAVTISGLDPAGYEGETAEYIRALNALNARLRERASAAAEMRDGVPFWSKGDPDEVLERLAGGFFDLQRHPDAAL